MGVTVTARSVYTDVPHTSADSYSSTVNARRYADCVTSMYSNRYVANVSVIDSVKPASRPSSHASSVRKVLRLKQL